MRLKHILLSSIWKITCLTILGQSFAFCGDFSKNPALLNEGDLRLRAKHQRIKTATENYYNGSIIFAEGYSRETRSKGKKYQQAAQYMYWEMLQSACQSIEVHYIKPGDPSFSHVVQINLDEPFSFKYDNDEQVISAVFWKPHPSKKPAGLGLFMHGGDSANKMGPYSLNPQQLAFLSLGYGFCALNYRGKDANIHNQDLQAALDYFATLNFIDSQKIVLAGISNGSTLNAQILGRPVAQKFAGVFLHTVFYNNPEIFDALGTLPRNLPIFLASGKLDLYAAYEHATQYIRALEDVSNNFSYALLQEGGHHLIKPVRLNNVAADKKTQKNVPVLDKFQASVRNVKNRYNFQEFYNYSQKLIEFLDEIKHPQDYFRSMKEERMEPDPQALLGKAKIQIAIKKLGKLKKLETYGCKDRKGSQKFNSLYHLGLILGDDFEEDNLENTIHKFLTIYDREKRQIFADYQKEYSPIPNKDELEKEKCAENQELKNQIFEILKTEIKHPDSFVLYHGCAAKVGFLYDVYSAFSRILEINGSQQELLRLRMNDDLFVRFVSNESFLEKFKKKSSKNLERLFNYLPWFPHAGLSTQYFLFGSYKNWFNSTFFRMFLQGESAGNIQLSIVEKLTSLFLYLGIGDKEEAEALAKTFENIYQKYFPEKNGRLLQIFLSPKAVENTCYLSERGGLPLEIYSKEDTLNPARLFEDDPNVLEGKLAFYQGRFKAQNTKDREEFSLKRQGLKYINYIENRLLMDPRFFDDPRHVKIVNYFKKNPPKEYSQAIEAQVSKILVRYLQNNPKLPAGHINKPPTLVRLADTINPERKKSRQSLSFLDLLISHQFDEASLWIEKYGLSDLIKPKGEFLERKSVFFHLLEKNAFTAAHWLAEKMPADELKQLINSSSFQTLFLRSNLRVAEFLVKHGLDIHAFLDNKPLLQHAIKKGNTHVALYLITLGIDIFWKNSKNVTYLMMACQYTRPQIVQALLEKNKELNGDSWQDFLLDTGEWGANALAYAFFGENSEAALMLLNSHVDWAVPQKHNNNPLLFVSEPSMFDAINVFLDKLELKGPKVKEAFINQTDGLGNTPLAHSIGNKLFAIAQNYIDGGAKIYDAKDKETLLHIALGLDNCPEEIVFSIVDKIRSQNEISLSDYLALQDENGFTALDLSIDKKKDSLAEHLIHLGAPFVYVSKEGCTPLVSAAKSGLIKTVRKILTRGAKEFPDEFEEHIYWKNEKNESALLLAVINDRKDTALELLKQMPNLAKADPQSKILFGGIHYNGEKFALAIMDKISTLKAQDQKKYLEFTMEDSGKKFRKVLYKSLSLDLHQTTLRLIKQGTDVIAPVARLNSGERFALDYKSSKEVIEAILDKLEEAGPEILLEAINRKNYEGNTVIEGINKEHGQIFMEYQKRAEKLLQKKN